MNSDVVNLDKLFDADEYMRSGHCPWTFFAYPTTIADNLGLPPDEDACRLLGTIQAHGIDVAIWVNGIADNTTYFACRQDDIRRLNDSLLELQQNGSFPENFCAKRSEQLFGLVNDHIELTVEEVVEIEGRGTAVFFTQDPDPLWPHSPQNVRIIGFLEWPIIRDTTAHNNEMHQSRKGRDGSIRSVN